MLSRRGFLAIVSALGATTIAAPALARSRRHRVVWTTIRFHDEADQKRHETSLRKFLEKEGRRANWGKRTEPVEASVDVRELSSGVDADICKVTCAAVGKIPGVGVVKSKFSYGGKASEREKLEKHVLELVARGIVTRLAEMARTNDGAWHVEKASPRRSALLSKRMAHCIEAVFQRGRPCSSLSPRVLQSLPPPPCRDGE